MSGHRLEAALPWHRNGQVFCSTLRLRLGATGLGLCRKEAPHPQTVERLDVEWYRHVQC